MIPRTTVQARDLTKRFGPFVAVDAISFEVHAGEIWGFLGPNGSGKSTTIRMLCGVLEPSAGSATVLGYDVARDPEDVKLRIGYMSQGSSLWSDLTVEEHLQLYAGLFGLEGRAGRDAVETWADRVGLRPVRNTLAGALPGGFRKRLALACTLMHKPQMLFLDEPTSGVDPLSRREFWDLIVEFADEGTTVLVTTHYLDEAEHCSQLALIYNGKIVARGSPEQLRRAPAAGATFEIVSPENARMANALEGLPRVRGFSMYGSALHVTVDRPEDIRNVAQTLRAAGYTIGDGEFRAITPALEDVFAALVESE